MPLMLESQEHLLKLSRDMDQLLKSTLFHTPVMTMRLELNSKKV